jgi:hypothetical protein
MWRIGPSTCITGVSQECYKSVARMLNEFYKNAIQVCYKSVSSATEVLQVRYRRLIELLGVCAECGCSATRLLQECYKVVARVLQECCKSVTRVLQECMCVSHLAEVSQKPIQHEPRGQHEDRWHVNEPEEPRQLRCALEHQTGETGAKLSHLCVADGLWGLLVLQEWYKDGTRVLQGCYKIVTIVFKSCPKMFQECCKCVTGALQGC